MCPDATYVTHLPDAGTVGGGGDSLLAAFLGSLVPADSCLVPVPLLVPGVGRALLHDGVQAAEHNPLPQ